MCLANRLLPTCKLDSHASATHLYAMMQKIEIYTKFGCPFCSRAKQLLTGKGADFVEYDITMGGPKRSEMQTRAPGSQTVPQIFIGGKHVGGCDDLYALDRAGNLDAMLAAQGNS
jgi:glutaredoxin 3